MHDWSDLDSVWLDEPGEADQARRLRLLLQGEWNARLAFKTQGEFKGGDPHLLEWWINWKTPDQPSLRVGHFREPFGLDARTSSAHITFVERSSPTQALTFGRNRGLEVHKSGTSSSWAAGVFQESMGMADEGLLHNRALTGRVTWLPLGNAPGEALLHLGMAATYRDTQADGVRLAADPEVHLARKGADTGTIAAESVSGLVFESVWVRGALTTQAELFFANLEQSSGPHAALHGGYLQVSSMLTGEQRAYREAIHSLGRLVVSRPTLGGGGPGAWELAARYSHTDLSDGYVDGGVMNNFTLGLT
jgi:phosphate-selective porin OprO/OprP